MFIQIENSKPQIICAKNNWMGLHSTTPDTILGNASMG